MTPLAGAVVALAIALLTAVWRISALVTQLKNMAKIVPQLQESLSDLRSDMDRHATKLEILYERFFSADDSSRRT